MATHQSALWNMRGSALIPLAALLVDPSTTAVAAQGRQPAAIVRADSFIRVARGQSRSVVFLHTIERDTRRDETEGLGSGVVVGPGGLILTNAHVVENASVVHVRLADGTDVPTTIIGRDPASDLALLRAADSAGLVPVTFGDSDILEAGAHVVAIGNPLGLHHTVTAGIVSAIARADEDSGLEFLQTDAAINPGSSGGGLFDLAGRLVGITSNIVAPRSGGNIGLNFAIPVNVIMVVLPQLRAGVVRHGWLGVSTLRVRAPNRKPAAAVKAATIGTVADVVPLIDENRILVRHGLNSLKAMPPPGLAALMQVAKLGEKPRLDSEDIAFCLAPRLNAAGRFGQAQLAVELLTTTSRERAQRLAEYIHELNGSRESLERSIQLAAAKQVKEQFDPDGDSALVLAGRGWHVGVIGLVAGKLAEKYHRPVALIALDQLGVKPGIGSARSPNGLNLHAALVACSDHLLGFGGHAAAAGLKIEETRIDAFRAAFCEHAASESSGAVKVGEIRIDAEGPFCQLTHETVRQIESLAPFGCGNPRPVLCATGIRLAEPPKRIGASERHLSLKLMQRETRIRGVGFGCAEWAEELAAASRPLDIAYKPVINDFRGRQSVEIQLVDWRVSEVTS